MPKHRFDPRLLSHYTEAPPVLHLQFRDVHAKVNRYVLVDSFEVSDVNEDLRLTTEELKQYGNKNFREVHKQIQRDVLSKLGKFKRTPKEEQEDVAPPSGKTPVEELVDLKGIGLAYAERLVSAGVEGADHFLGMSKEELKALAPKVKNADPAKLQQLQRLNL